MQGAGSRESRGGGTREQGACREQGESKQGESKAGTFCLVAKRKQCLTTFLALVDISASGSMQLPAQRLVKHPPCSLPPAACRPEVCVPLVSGQLHSQFQQLMGDALAADE